MFETHDVGLSGILASHDDFDDIKNGDGIGFKYLSEI